MINCLKFCHVCQQIISTSNGRPKSRERDFSRNVPIKSYNNIRITIDDHLLSYLTTTLSTFSRKKDHIHGENSRLSAGGYFTLLTRSNPHSNSKFLGTNLSAGIGSEIPISKPAPHLSPWSYLIAWIQQIQHGESLEEWRANYSPRAGSEARTDRSEYISDRFILEN